MNELEQYFIYKCEKGLASRGLSTKPEYQKRLDFEILTILKMGYAGYFLIVQDFINWAKSNGIYVGPGRGSAAGSLASYCMGITELDPIRWSLLFERFLNPGRLGRLDFGSEIEKLVTTSSLTNQQIADILTSVGVDDARLQNI